VSPALVRMGEGATLTFVPGTPKEIAEGICSPSEIVAQLEAIHGRMSSPAEPVVTPQGTQQTGEYGYQVVAVNAAGQDTIPSPIGFTCRANAILNAIDSNLVEWDPVAHANGGYRILRVKAPLHVTTGLIGEVPASATSFTDEGQVATPYVPASTQPPVDRVVIEPTDAATA
jgi:hypothetical protein